MAFAHGSNAVVLCNGFNLTGFLRSVTIGNVADTAEVTTLGDTAKDYLAGLKDATLSADGMFDGAVNQLDSVLATALGTNPSVWSVMPVGDVIGYPAYGFNAIANSYEIASPVDDVSTIAVEAQSNVGPERCTVHHVHSAETAAAQGASQDNSASSANGGVGYLQATAITATTATVKVQHSSDNAVWVDLITFTAVTSAAVAKERKTVSGTVNRYTRSDISGTFAGGSVTFSLIFGRK